MDWDDLKYFLALVRNGSVRAAGAHVGVSHSTVARRIEALEAKMAVRLFDRTPDGIVPTAAGLEMIDAAERIEAEMAAIERTLVGLDRHLSGEIRATMPDAVASGLLMPDFVRFTRDYPDIDLVIASSYELADLSRREADVAIRLLVIGRQPPEHLVGRRLGTIYATAYAAPAYLETVDLEHDPAGARWIGWGGDDRYPGWVRTSPFPEIPARGRIDDAMIQLEAARQGMGLAQLPCFLGDPDPALVRVGPGPPQPNFDIWLLSHPDLRDTARLRVFRDRIAEAIRAKSDLLEGRVGR